MNSTCLQCTLWNFLTIKNLGFVVFLMADQVGSGILTVAAMKTILETVHSVQSLDSLSLMMSILAKVKDSCIEFDKLCQNFRRGGR